MKRIYMTIAACAAIFATTLCSGKKNVAEQAAETPAEVLLGRLTALSDSGLTAFGHHDDTAYGRYWEYQPDSSDVKNVCGDYPAIINWDLGWIETGAEKQLDGVPFDFMRDEIVRHDARGGINSLSWHLLNPVTGGDSWDTSCDSTLTRIFADKALTDTLTRWIGLTADFIGNLRDAEGNRIPVMYRPWHEHTGEWFWWGINEGTPEDYKNLWKLTRKVFDEKGIDNVVWVYSPDKSNVNGYDDYMSRYPGDEYVDVMGADVYYFDEPDSGRIFTERIDKTLGAAVRAAREHGKIAALSETGFESLPVDDWYMNTLMPVLEKYPVAFVTVWRNSNTKPNHWYAPYSGHPGEADFRAFHDSPCTVFAREMNEIR
ncbi:beta-mannosidase [Muribaculaceae bacterium Isolate-002 (NCI)]|nr:beta-mannosidase [Muribaculaceae bacterium Isolate-002 (NCI)]